MKNEDKLLDEIIARLQSEPAPPMPPELMDPRQTRHRSWMWTAVGAGALAASFLGFWLLQSLSPDSGQFSIPDIAHHPDPDIPTANIPEDNIDGSPIALQTGIAKSDDSKITVRPIDLTKPLAQLEANLDSLDDEIAALQMRAALLDARRMADELLAQH